MDDKMITNMAKTLNVDATTLRARAEEVMIEQGQAWLNAGKSESDAGILSLRVAARLINTEQARLKRSGASVYEGMFVDVSRPKMWGEWGYKKMKTQLMSADDAARDALVQMGAVVLYEDNHDGTYTRRCREDFGADGSDVGDLPRHTMRLDDNTHFYCVWDKTNPTFANGNDNFKFGKPRPQDDRERITLFLGRVQGSNSEPTLHTVRAQGTSADVQHPTFLTGTIPLRAGNNGNAYAKPNISVLTPDPTLTSMFSAPPVMLGEAGFTGIVPESDEWDMLDSLMDLGGYYDTHHGQDGWYNRKQAVVTEVIHIDPRENGGFVIMCADLDMASTASTADIYISSEDEGLVDFGVGSKMLVTGQVWRTEDGEERFGVNGWYAFDTIAPMGNPGGDDVGGDF